MLGIFKTQLTDESESDEAGPPVRGLLRTSETARESSPEDDAAPDTTSDATSPEAPAIELDEVFGLLKNRRRRDVLRHLVENADEVRIGALAEKIAARECGKDASQINSQERKRVYVGLYQSHLPKLADVGVIDYNKPRGTIERGPNFDQITHYLPADETNADPKTANRPLLESLSNVMATGRNFL